MSPQERSALGQEIVFEEIVHQKLMITARAYKINAKGGEQTLPIVKLFALASGDLQTSECDAFRVPTSAKGYTKAALQINLTVAKEDGNRFGLQLQQLSVLSPLVKFTSDGLCVCGASFESKEPFEKDIGSGQELTLSAGSPQAARSSINLDLSVRGSISDRLLSALCSLADSAVGRRF